MSKNPGYPVQQQRITILARHHGSKRDYTAAGTIVMFHIENIEYIEEGRLFVNLGLVKSVQLSFQGFRL